MVRTYLFSQLLIFLLAFPTFHCGSANLLSRYNVGDSFILQFSELTDTRQIVNNFKFDQLCSIETDLIFRLQKVTQKGITLKVTFDKINVNHMSPVGRFCFSSDSLTTPSNLLLKKLTENSYQLQLSVDGGVISVQQNSFNVDAIANDTSLIIPENQKKIFKSILSNLDIEKIRVISQSFFPAVALSHRVSKPRFQFMIPAGVGLNGNWNIQSIETSRINRIKGEGHYVAGDSIFHKAPDGMLKRTILTGNLLLNIDLSKTEKQIASICYSQQLKGTHQIKDQEKIISVPMKIDNIISIALIE